MSITQNQENLLYHIPLPNNKKITLYKNGNNENIYYYFRFEKKSYQGSTGTSDLSLSINEGFKIYTQISTGKRKKGSKSSNKFEVVCEKYLKYLQEDKEIKPSQRTINDYKRYSKFLLKKFRGRDIETLCDVNVYTDYKKWRGSYYKTHKNERRKKYKRNGKEWFGQTYNKVGSVPINKDLRFLLSVLRFSKYNLKLLPTIDIPKCEMKKEKKGKDTMNDTDFEKLRDYMSLNRPFQWSIISFINSTGIRYPSELLRIKWKDIDWETPCVWIRNRKNPKGESVNTPFPLIGTGLEVIQTLWSRENISKQPNDPVFVNDKGKQVKSIRKCFKTSLEKCGLDPSFTIYGFRSRFTERMVLRNDIPPIVLSSLMGHKSLDMIMSVYHKKFDKDKYKKILTDSRKNEKRKKKQQKEEQQNKTNIEPDVPDFV